MRWDDLFRDLEAQLEAAETSELAAEVADRTRREIATVALLERARAAVGHPVRLQLWGSGAVAGMLLEVGVDWLLLRDAVGHDVLVSWGSVLGVTGLGVASASPDEVGVVFRRLGLGSALRAIARDRDPVAVTLVDGSLVTGTIDRVGMDFVEVGEHPVGEQRRTAEVTAVRTLAFAGLATVTRMG
jgi:hypothetical protein